jgi:eukaryotic-like serine/threonine-protein kinase
MHTRTSPARFPVDDPIATNIRRMPLAPGTVFASYTVIRLLGAGGMGEVYLATDAALPRHVALKVLSAELSRDPDFRARFIREADTAAALEHPHIVSIYNRGQTEHGQLWIAMQFVDGTDADAALQAGTMTPHRAVHILAEVAKALDFAHANNVVHRDIKPANFLLSGPVGTQERVLLGDFGIARALDDAGLTATGSVVATVAYAAPELLSNAPIDGRADIYALGCTLYRLLTGKTPFPANNGAAAVMTAHLFSPPPRVTDEVPTLPVALDRVVAIAMAKDPAQRFPTAGALAAAAVAAVQDPSRFIPLPPVPSAEVSSYPTASPLPPWWQHGAPRTMTAIPGLLAPTAAPPARAAPRARARRRLVIATALTGVMLLSAAITIAIWPHDTGTDPTESGAARPSVPQTAIATTPSPPPTVSPSDLADLLPSLDEVKSIASDPNLTLVRTEQQMSIDESVTLERPECDEVLGQGSPKAYDLSAVTGYYTSDIGDSGAAPPMQMAQGVAAFHDATAARKQLTRLHAVWQQCANSTQKSTVNGVTIDNVIGAPVDAGKSLSTLSIQLVRGSRTVSSVRAIAAKANVVIDLYAIAATTDRADQIARAIARSILVKIPD